MSTEMIASKASLYLCAFLAVSLLVIAAIMLDLWDGVYTARQTGSECTATSYASPSTR